MAFAESEADLIRQLTALEIRANELRDELAAAQDRIDDLEQEVKDLKEANDKMQTALDDISYTARHAL